MKKLLALLLALVMVFSLMACASDKDAAEKDANAGNEDTSNAGDTSDTGDTGDAAAEPSGESLTIAMLPKFKGENYFDACKVGAEEAAA